MLRKITLFKEKGMAEENNKKKVSFFGGVILIVIVVALLGTCGSGGGSVKARWVQAGDNYDFTFYFDGDGMVKAITRVHPDPFNSGGTITSKHSVSEGDMSVSGTPSSQKITIYESSDSKEVFMRMEIESGKIYQDGLQGTIIYGDLP